MLPAWSAKEAYVQGNATLVEVGNWCSGTVIDKNKGYVVTAAHCVKTLITSTSRWRDSVIGTVEDKTVTSDDVTLSINHLSPDGTQGKTDQYQGKVIARDEDADVAIIEIKSKLPLPADVVVQYKPVEYGDKVYAVGNPQMHLLTVTEGIVAKPKGLIEGTNAVDAIFHTAPMNHGSSGGGLFNDAGELIGITNWMSSVGADFAAASVSHVKELLTAIEKKEPLK